MIKSILITGANAGLGKEAARQFVKLPHTEKVYLGCRNMKKAEEAKQELVEATGRDIFEIVLIDVSDQTSVRNAVDQLNDPIDALVMNAGGLGGKMPYAKTKDGVTNIVAANVLGHIVLLDKLLADQKLTQVALYAGSEAIRGVKAMGIKPVEMQSGSVDEFVSLINGTHEANESPALESYAYVKYLAVMSLLATARKNPQVRIISMSPGGTNGTNAAEDLTGIMKFLMKTMSKTLMPIMGVMHSLETGAKRYVDGITDERFKTGTFYASSRNKPTGDVGDQSVLFPELKNESYQDNAYEAIHRFTA